MSKQLATRIGQSFLMLGLYAPLIAYVSHLRDQLVPGQGVTDLSPTSLLLLLLLLLLPHAVLALFGLRWNPARARLGEPDV